MPEAQMLFQFGSTEPKNRANGTITADGCHYPILLRRHPRARQYILRLRSDGTVVVTIPSRGSKAEAWRLIQSREVWITRQWKKLQARVITPRQWPVGTEILLRGRPHALELVHQAGLLVLRIGPTSIHLRQPASDLRPMAETLLRRLAEQELPPRVHELAAREGISIHSVTVRSQSSRWGSCSSAGRISLNWRLIQMPPEVRDYIILHELMHRREMNHSSRFWNLVAAACPHWKQHEHWIQSNAARLGM